MENFDRNTSMLKEVQKEVSKQQKQYIIKSEYPVKD